MGRILWMVPPQALEQLYALSVAQNERPWAHAETLRDISARYGATVYVTHPLWMGELGFSVSAIQESIQKDHFTHFTNQPLELQQTWDLTFRNPLQVGSEARCLE